MFVVWVTYTLSETDFPYKVNKPHQKIPISIKSLLIIPFSHDMGEINKEVIVNVRRNERVPRYASAHRKFILELLPCAPQLAWYLMKVDVDWLNSLDCLKNITLIIRLKSVCDLQNLRHSSDTWLFVHDVCCRTVCSSLECQTFGICSNWSEIPPGLSQDYLWFSAIRNEELLARRTAVP